MAMGSPETPGHPNDKSPFKTICLNPSKIHQHHLALLIASDVS
jgi:hypothetical protein